MKFLAQLQNPPREFTAIPFWFLNGELTAEELRRQLADFAAHGIYGVVLHPRMGLSPAASRRRSISSGCPLTPCFRWSEKPPPRWI